MSSRNEIVRLSGRARTRANGGLRRPPEDLEEFRELDTESLDSLLLDFGAEEVERAACPPDEADDASDDLEADAPPTPAQELADAWMLKGGKTPLLSPMQEIMLAKRIERGDSRAREELINANVRLVASVARRYQGRGLPLDDLMQEGLIGLMRAIEKYNYRKGYRFSTYATFWIRQAVSRALANQGRSIRLPAHIVDTIHRLARVRDELFQRLGRPPTREEVAEAANISEKRLLLLLNSAAQPLSLETPIGEEGESRLGDFIPADEESAPASRVFRHLVREEIERAMSILTPRERDVLTLRFGLSGEEPHTLEEAGRRLHITRERARQIEAKSLAKLQNSNSLGRLREAVG